jgi:crotonobetainyl-CoA:carnitine CoA-transferase CaiB-like acyl-CoA transferase
MNGPLPLSGVRVVEFTIAWAGPLAGRWLADLGAEVIHLEPRTGRGLGVTGAGGFAVGEDVSDWKWGDLPGPVFRAGIYPDADPGERPWNRQGVFNKMQRNKLSLCVDLKTEAGKELLADLIKVTDIVLDNFSPRGVRSLGIDYESLVALNPALIRASLSGYGHTGPDQMRPSWGPILEAHSGMAWTTGYADGGPLKVGVALPDPTGGMHAVVAMLAALEERDRTGNGCFIDLSQFETYAAVGGEKYLEASVTGEVTPRLGNRSLDCVPQGVYPCRGSDEWIAISVQSDEEWTVLEGFIGAVPGAGDLAALETRMSWQDEIDIAIRTWTNARDRFAAMAELQSAGVRASAVMTNRDLVESEQIDARGFIVEWDQVDVGPRKYPGFPVHFEDPAEIEMRSSPALGEDNEHILVDILGYSPERVRELTDMDVLATTPE